MRYVFAYKKWKDEGVRLLINDELNPDLFFLEGISRFHFRVGTDTTLSTPSDMGIDRYLMSSVRLCSAEDMQRLVLKWYMSQV